MIAQACDRHRIEGRAYPANSLVGAGPLFGSPHRFLTQFTLSTAEMSQGVKQMVTFQAIWLTPLPIQLVQKTLNPQRQPLWRPARNRVHFPKPPAPHTVARKTAGDKEAVRRTCNSCANSLAGVILLVSAMVGETIHIVAAPSSTKNSTGERDPEMHQTRKGNQWFTFALGTAAGDLATAQGNPPFQTDPVPAFLPSGHTAHVYARIASGA